MHFMTIGMTSISPSASATAFTFAPIFHHHHLRMVFISQLIPYARSCSTNDQFYTRSVLKSRQVTHRQVDVTGVSKVSFADSSLQILQSL
jgi:hypothetical protein